MSATLTASQAARRAGISLSTLERHLPGWLADGRVTVTRTPGGHRRFDPAEIDALKPPPDPTPLPSS